MLTLTNKAIEKLKEYAAAEELPASVRCICKGGSCAGLTGDMMLEEVSNETDEIFEQDGVKIIIDQFSVHYLDRAIIDFVDSGMTFGFKFLFKDDSVQSCGCEKSWGYK